MTLLPQYRKIINGFALKSLLRIPDVPGPALAVGAAEVMEPIFGRKLLPRQKVRWKPPYNWTRKEAFDHQAEGPAVKPDDFPKTGWAGDPLG